MHGGWALDAAELAQVRNQRDGLQGLAQTLRDCGKKHHVGLMHEFGA